MNNSPRLITNIDITNTAQKFLSASAFIELQNKKGQIIISSLLSDNTKMAKGNKLNYGFSMLPADTLKQYVKAEYQGSVLNVCPKATDNDCQKTCLGLVSGMFSMRGGAAFKSLIKKAVLFNYEFETFKECLEDELAVLASYQKRKNRKNNSADKVHIRLDVFSDNKKRNIELINQLNGEFKTIRDNIEFYDYTKLHSVKMLKQAQTNDYNIALSVSRHTLEDSQAIKTYKECTNYARYSAIVVSPETHKNLLAWYKNLAHNVILDGDIFDTFTLHDNDKNTPHQFLLLKGKAASNANKSLVADSMELTFNDVITIVTAIQSENKRFNSAVIKSMDL